MVLLNNSENQQGRVDPPTGSDSKSKPEIDLWKLAEKVYEKLKEELVIENQRQGIN